MPRLDPVVDLDQPNDDQVDPVEYWFATGEGWDDLSQEDRRRALDLLGVDLTESRLEEHPGHASQKVHGRRGGVSPVTQAVRDFRASVAGGGAWPSVGETGGLMDPVSGQITHLRRGEQFSVDFTGVPWDEMKGKVLIHSHPGADAMGLSDGDAQVAVRANLAEIRAETATGSVRMLPGTDPGVTGNRWSPHRQQAETAAEAGRIWNESVDRAFAELDKVVGTPEYRSPDLAKLTADANRAVAAAMGWQYIEEPAT